MLEKSTAADLSAPQLWESVRDKLRAETETQDFHSWIAPLALKGFSGGVVELSVPTRFKRDWVRSHYADRIRALWAQESGAPARIEVVVGAGEEPAPREVALPPAANDGAPQDTLSAPLDPRCTFAHFIKGPANALAAAAAGKMAAGEASFNPLYIHGAVGLGKTHLLQALAAARRAASPSETVAYMTAERFMFRFVQALRSKDTMAFKAACRGIDMLLVDDIQFICGKEATQDEFLSVLDALTAEGKPVAVAADRAPAELDAISDRLRSRLGGGLVAVVTAPDEELRLKILESRRAMLGRDIPDDVLALLAARVDSNVRALEGALNRLVAHAELTARALDTATAEDILKDVLRTGEGSLTISDIQKKVASHYGLKVADMISPRRTRAVARPRQVAMYLCKALTQFSLPDIGRAFGGRDHTTIIHGVRKVEDMMARDQALASDVEALKRALAG